MKNLFKKAFGAPEAGARATADSTPREEGDIRIAACALFLEMAGIDNEFADEERRRILTLLQEEFGLTEEHALELTREVATELQGSIDLWRFTSLINDNYSDVEKTRVVEMLWRVVYADGHLDEHEDYLMHKLGKLLGLQHKQLIAAKLRVLRDSETQGD